FDLDPGSDVLVEAADHTLTSRRFGDRDQRASEFFEPFRIALVSTCRMPYARRVSVHSGSDEHLRHSEARVCSSEGGRAFEQLVARSDALERPAEVARRGGDSGCFEGGLILANDRVRRARGRRTRSNTQRVEPGITDLVE